jgi:hypothetical protein
LCSHNMFSVVIYLFPVSSSHNRAIRWLLHWPSREHVATVEEWKYTWVFYIYRYDVGLCICDWLKSTTLDPSYVVSVGVWSLWTYFSNYVT